MFYGYEHIIDGTYVSNFSELLRYIYEKYCKLNSHDLERRSLIKLHYAWTKIYSKKNQNLFYYAKVELYLTCVKVVRTFELVKKNAKEMLSLSPKTYQLLLSFGVCLKYHCEWKIKRLYRSHKLLSFHRRKLCSLGYQMLLKVSLQLLQLYYFCLA